MSRSYSHDAVARADRANISDWRARTSPEFLPDAFAGLGVYRPDAPAVRVSSQANFGTLQGGDGREHSSMPKKKNRTLNNPMLAQAFREQHAAFIERFGREPNPGDPLLFCWHSPTPVPLCELCLAEYEHGLVEAAKKAGIDPARALKAGGIDDRFGSLKTKN